MSKNIKINNKIGPIISQINSTALQNFLDGNLTRKSSNFEIRINNKLNPANVAIDKTKVVNNFITIFIQTSRKKGL